MDESFAKELQDIRWFSRCGTPVSAVLPFPIEQVSGRGEAIERCSDQAWEDVTLEARNLLTEFLHAKHRVEYQRWNTIAEEAERRIITPLRDRFWQPFADENTLGQSFLDCVSWDVMAAVMEHEYRGSRGRPDFFLGLLEVYRAGFFPCGWSGDWPGGTLWVW